ncbi:hypothetical protein DK150_450006 [Flavobacterium psychrophilum]|nr:hypothetical protein DK150_450006 [Flavobacterium psychrophilum]
MKYKMNKTILILIFVIFPSVNIFSQNNQKIFRNVIRKDGYDYIATEFLNDSTIIGLKHKLELYNSKHKIRNFEFNWRSLCTDGTYYLKITPEQIYLYSGHENPNPNRIYWIININKLVYITLRKNYKNIKELSCSKSGCFDEKYNEETILKGDNYDNCDEILQIQTKKIINKINNLITERKFKIDINKKIEPKKRLLYNN